MRRGSGRGRAARGRKAKPALGEFVNFPIITHGSLLATCDERTSLVQRALIRAFSKLNGSSRPYPLSISGREGTFEGRVGFEMGVAEGEYFDYLDEEAADRLRESMEQGKPYATLDFIVVITYSYRVEKRVVHLNYDHHQLRFTFGSGELEIRLFHSRGIRRMPIDELFGRIVDAINVEMQKEKAEKLKVEKMRTL